MVANKIAENVLGAIGMVFRTIRLLPQIWKSYWSKSTDGLSEWSVLMLGISGLLRGIYVIVQNLNIPVILQPHVLAFLSAILWTQCLFYGRKWSSTRCVICFATCMALMCGFEAAMIYAISKPPARNGSMIPLDFFNILSTVINALGFMPQCWEIYKRKEVIGLSIASTAANVIGGIFLILSLAFDETFDVLASVYFLVNVVVAIGIIIAALVLNPIAKRKRSVQTSKLVQVAEVPMVNILTSDAGDSGSPEKSDLELGENLIGGGNMTEA